LEQDTTGSGPVGSLADAVEAGGPLAFTDVLRLGADVAEDLEELHGTGQAHGAVDPTSIVQGSAGPWMLAAPGLAQAATPARAPELSSGGSTPAGDVYALGAALVFALTGQRFETGALGEEPPADEAAAPADASAAPTASAAPDLPEVMALFLTTLRRTLATDPAARPGAGQLAATLRQLRADADRAMAPAAVPSAAAADGTTVVPMVAPLGAGDGGEGGDGTGDGTDAAAAGAGRSRGPFLVAAAAILVAAILAVALLRKGNEDNLLTTATIPSTTLPPATVDTTPPSSDPGTTVALPPTTVPPNTFLVTVDMSGYSYCDKCLANLRALPQKAATITASLPDKTGLWGKCFTTGDQMQDNKGFTSNIWVYVVGPVAPGWLPLTQVAGHTTIGLTSCPNQAPTTTVPTTIPTTTAPVTTTTLPITTTTPPPTTRLTTTTTSKPITTTTSSIPGH
jgi:hypothetical protein